MSVIRPLTPIQRTQEQFKRAGIQIQATHLKPNGQIKQSVFCAVSLDNIHEAKQLVVASDGHIYEAETLKALLKKNELSPMTRSPFPNHRRVPLEQYQTADGKWGIRPKRKQLDKKPQIPATPTVLIAAPAAAPVAVVAAPAPAVLNQAQVLRDARRGALALLGHNKWAQNKNAYIERAEYVIHWIDTNFEYEGAGNTKTRREFVKLNTALKRALEKRRNASERREAWKKFIYGV